MHADNAAEDRNSHSSYGVGILVGVLFWLTGCSLLPKPTAGESAPIDPFLQSGPVGTAAAPASKPAKGDAVAQAAVPAPKPAGTVTSAAVPAPRPGPTMTPGGAAAKLMPPDTLSPGTATLVSGTAGANDGKPSAVLQPPLQQAEWQGGNQALTLEEAIRQVQLRNVSAQRLDQRGDKWHFSCEIPKPNDPGVSKLYEAEAEKAVDAVQAVLAQIDQDQPRK